MSLKLKEILILIIVLIYFTGCITTDETNHSTPVSTPLASVEIGTIEGIIMDSVTREPVEGATVEMEKTKLNCKTKKDGKYKLSNFGGNQVIIVKKTGYKINTRNIFISTGETVRENILLIPQKPSATPVQKIKPVILATNYYSNELIAIDIEKNTIIQTIPLGREPGGIAFSPEKSTVYIVNSTDNNITVLNISKELKLTGHISVNKNPTSIVATRDTIYVANSKSNNISVIDIKENRPFKNITVEKMPTGMCFDEKNQFIYVMNSMANNISVISCNSNSLVKTLEAGKFPCSGAVSPDGEYLYVVNQVSEDLSVIELKKQKTLLTIPLGKGPKNCLLLPSGEKLYITNYQDNTLSVIDCRNNKSIKTVETGKNPSGLAFLKNKKKLYVANGGSNTISIIDVETDQLIREIPGGNFPYELIIIQ
ncbi:MAG TPA: beta-propeller fold lactonase family protein [Candidatus Eremiobacteraeota bacterium]|nr:MAG: 6-phosphogluconolactonase [bacterium ADurb.Bin363]HPZ06777.1 beta-propeller fold lactonase family protein [Candidatus Eremiobacteraeota bacterium]